MLADALSPLDLTTALRYTPFASVPSTLPDFTLSPPGSPVTNNVDDFINDHILDILNTLTS
jgi:hypothetical protein